VAKNRPHYRILPTPSWKRALNLFFTRAEKGRKPEINLRAKPYPVNLFTDSKKKEKKA
jgi:hypothetical protein